MFAVLDWYEVPQDVVPQETVLQAALVMKAGCLKVLKIGVTPSQCMRLLRELPHCTCLRKFGILLSPSLEVCVSWKSAIHGSLWVA